MSDRNLAIVRKSFELWNAHDPEGFAATGTEDCIYESDALPAPGHGQRGIAQMARIYFTAFPDVQIEIQSQYAAGDTVITQWRVVGTHGGEFMGIPASGKKIDLHACTINQLRDGKILHGRTYYDTGRLLQQIGVLPARAASAS